jgi:aldose 1-epimerase
VQRLRLRNGSLEASILPDCGAGLASFDWVEGGSPLPLMRRLSEEIRDPDPNQLACYPLVPWSNRIGHGRFELRGTTFRLAPNYPGQRYPIHGEGWLSRWKVAGQTDASAELTLDRSGGSPFAYAANLSYSMSDRSMSVELSVENRGNDDMPYGLGLHPWFDRTPGVLLRAPARGIWLSGDDLLPVGHSAPPEDARFDRVKPLPRRLIDNCFTGWDGTASISWPERGAELRIESTPRLERYVLYCPPGQAHFCFEPVTHDIDAFNLPEPFARGGLKILAPGESLSMRVNFEASFRES